MKPPKLNLPPFDIRLQNDDDGNVKVFDRLRRKFVALTPEEYVRQHFVNWLIETLGYPPHMIANEVGITVNDTIKRCDTVIFGRDGNPLIIIEYKAPSVKITQNTFDQVYRYNLALKAKMLIVSNGMNHYCCVIDYKNDTYHFIPQIPDYIGLIYGQQLS